VDESRPPLDITPEVYEAFAARQRDQDALLWQTPALSLTAQAFLFSIALSHGNTEAARLLAASLSLIISFLSIQLMAKHRYIALVRARLLVRLESNQEITAILGVSPHADIPALGAAANEPENWFVALRSSLVWMYGLAIFGIASAAVIVMTAVWPSTLA
jgi:hypothetical protein